MGGSLYHRLRFYFKNIKEVDINMKPYIYSTKSQEDKFLKTHSFLGIYLAPDEEGRKEFEDGLRYSNNLFFTCTHSTSIFLNLAWEFKRSKVHRFQPSSQEDLTPFGYHLFLLPLQHHRDSAPFSTLSPGPCVKLTVLLLPKWIHDSGQTQQWTDDCSFSNSFMDVESHNQSWGYAIQCKPRKMLRTRCPAPGVENEINVGKL